MSKINQQNRQATNQTDGETQITPPIPPTEVQYVQRGPLQFQSLDVCHLRVLHVPQLRQCYPKVVHGIGALRMEVESSCQVHEGGCELAGVEEDEAHVVMGDPFKGVEVEGTPQAGVGCWVALGVARVGEER